MSCHKCHKEMKLGDKAKIICMDCYEQISDLEEKLAESEKRFQDHKQVDAKTIQDQTDLIEQLKQQLAEKDEEILKISEYFGKVTFELRELCNKKDQDKISFALEQLSQAIKNIKKCNYKDFGIMYQSDAIAVIDNQIKAIKGEK